MHKKSIVIIVIIFFSLFVSIRIINHGFLYPASYNIYNGGNGYDSDAMNFINLPEARNIIYDKKLYDVGIAVIDTGIDQDVWEYIEKNYPTDIKLVVSTATGWAIYDKPWEIPSAKDGNGHGTTVVSVLNQVAYGATIYVIDTSDTGAYSVSSVVSALEWIHDFNARKDTTESNDIDIISISLVTYNYYKDLENAINNLIDQGCIIVASSGNDDINKIAYPAKFSDVIAVGAIFDDPDGYLTNGAKFNTAYTGYRVTKSISSEYRDYSWGSNYGSNLDFVAPGFDIEAISYKIEGYQGSSSDIRYVVVDGTSYAAPIVAGVVALIWYAYYKTQGLIPSLDYILKVLRETAENDPNNPERVPVPILNGKVYGYNDESSPWQDRVGYGVVDAYDAVDKVYRAPTGSSGSSGATIF